MPGDDVSVLQAGRDRSPAIPRTEGILRTAREEAQLSDVKQMFKDTREQSHDLDRCGVFMSYSENNKMRHGKIHAEGDDDRRQFSYRHTHVARENNQYSGRDDEPEDS